MLLGSEINESVTYKFAQMAEQLKQQGRTIISLGLGEPDFETPRHIIDATYAAMLNGFTKYSFSMGLLELRERISFKLQNENGCSYGPNQVVVAPGAKQAMFLALAALLQPGDEVINFTPFYNSYVPMMKIAEPNCIIHNIKLNPAGFSIDFDQVEKLVNHRTKVMVFNTPHNPTGKVFTAAEIQKIADLALKYDFYIVADEIYEKLCFGEEKHLSIASLDNMAARVFTVNGFSKAYAMTGWRIGYVAAPQTFISAINKLQQHINTCTCTFTQKGAVAAFTGGDLHIQEYNKKLQARFELFRDFIDRQKIIKCNIPSAGFFAFADISALNMNSNDFCSLLLDKYGIATTPGISFGKDWDDHVRISLAADETILREAFASLRTFIHNL